MPKQNLPGVVDIIRDLRQALPYCFHALSRILLMLSWDVMIPLCHADMKLPGYLSWNVPFDGAVIRPITEGISSYIHALP